MYYVNKTQAMVNVYIECFEKPEEISEYMLLAYLLVQADCTDLQNKDKNMIVQHKAFKK